MPNPKKPYALLLLHGNPGKRKLNTKEPKFPGKPICPGWLHPIAKREWKRVEREFAHTDLLSAVDTAALASYCQSYARWRLAEQIVQREGQIVEEPILTRQGSPTHRVRIRKHPAVNIAKDERASMLAAGRLFGLNPSSRTRFSVPDAPVEQLEDGSDADLFGPIG